MGLFGLGIVRDGTRRLREIEVEAAFHRSHVMEVSYGSGLAFYFGITLVGLCAPFLRIVKRSTRPSNPSGNIGPKNTSRVFRTPPCSHA